MNWIEPAQPNTNNNDSGPEIPKHSLVGEASTLEVSKISVPGPIILSFPVKNKHRIHVIYRKFH